MKFAVTLIALALFGTILERVDRSRERSRPTVELESSEVDAIAIGARWIVRASFRGRVTE